MSKNYCIIPARAGSKGLPGKNVKELCGVPLVNLSVLAAHESEVFDAIFVSSNDVNVFNCLNSLKVFKSNSNSIYYVERPHALCSDSSTTEGAVYHLFKIMNDFTEEDTFTILQPTSPFRHNNLIFNYYEKFINSSKLTGFTASKVTPFLWKDGEPLYKINNRKMRQDLSKEEFFYHEDGNIFSFYKKHFDKTRNRISLDPYIHNADEVYSLQIDNQLDFDICSTTCNNVKEIKEWINKLCSL